MSIGTVEAVIAAVATPQFGLVTRAQLLDAGVSERRIDHRLVTQRLVFVHPTVYAVPGSPRSWSQRLLGACLWVGEGTVVSHGSAATIWGYPGFGHRVAEVVTPRGPSVRRPSVQVHTTRYLPPCDIGAVDGLRTTTAARTLFDVAPRVRERALVRMIDHGLRSGLFTVSRLTDQVVRMASANRRCVRLERAISSYEPGEADTDSDLERDLCDLIAAHGLPAPVRQFTVKVGGRTVGTVDLCYPHERLVLETDGYQDHSSRRRFEDDRALQNELIALGWRVLRFTSSMVRGDPRATIDLLAAALGTSVPAVPSLRHAVARAHATGR